VHPTPLQSEPRASLGRAVNRHLVENHDQSAARPPAPATGQALQNSAPADEAGRAARPAPVYTSRPARISKVPYR
jgi:hypothetical protein